MTDFTSIKTQQACYCEMEDLHFCWLHGCTPLNCKELRKMDERLADEAIDTYQPKHRKSGGVQTGPPMRHLPKHMDDDLRPVVPGFYYNVGAAQALIYCLDASGQWWAISASDPGRTEKCGWEYVEQTLGAYPLARITSRT